MVSGALYVNIEVHALVYSIDQRIIRLIMTETYKFIVDNQDGVTFESWTPGWAQGKYPVTYCFNI